MSYKKQKVTRQHPLNYKVDIITATYGGVNFMKRLAPSLLEEHDAGVSFKWTIVDDATPPDRGREELIAYLRELDAKYPQVQVIESKVNGGFAKANNIAASKGHADYILMLNSDTIVINDGWLKEMQSNFERYPNVGVVGAKLLFFPDSTHRNRPAGTVQHAGVGFNLLGQPEHMFIGWPADHPKVNEHRFLSAVTGACLMTTRTLWKFLGGMAEVYTTGNFEDVEYCVRAASKGRISLYDPDVVLYHYAGGSDNTPTAQRNYQIFKIRNEHLTVYDNWLHW